MSQLQDITEEGVESRDENNLDRKNKTGKDEVTEENCRFDEGQPLSFVRVRFPGHNKSYPFLIGKRKLMYGQKVMAMSDRGMAVGYINSFSYQLPFSKDMLPLRYIAKIASDEDIQKEKENYKKQKESETICQNLIEKHNLGMNLTHVEFTQFGKKIVFYFVAPERVDFRNLVKDLVTELKLRIELRQISVRDRAASMGALGPCGRELCCSSFLSRYGNAAVKMAKNQNLSLNYSKLNGVCGQLKCCLQYEDDVYAAKRKKLPEEGTFAITHNGDRGKVNRIHILSEQFDMITNEGKIKRYVAEMFKQEVTAEVCRFPDRFDNVSDETSVVVGLSDFESKKARQFEKDLEKIKKRAHQYAFKTFGELTGIEAVYQDDQGQFIEEEAIVDEISHHPPMQSFEASEDDFQEDKGDNNINEQTSQANTIDSRSQNDKEGQPRRNHRGHRRNRSSRHRNNNRGANRNNSSSE
jgi:cell fate regulator YaaT (PSP1 superfamily)